MCHTITAASTYVEQRLGPRSSGTVHSVYKKTVNIRTDEYLLALQAASSPLSPISMITDMDVISFEKLPVRPGQPVSITGGRVTISSPACAITFLYQPEELYDSRLISPPSVFSCSELLSRIRQAITDSQAGIFRLLFCDSPGNGETPMGCGSDGSQGVRMGCGSDGSQSSDHLILDAARRHIFRCSNYLEQEMYGPAAENLAKLIGLGIGLTPSGDDFLCGALAGLILCGLGDHPFALSLCQEVRAHISDTNDISRAFLDCALTHHFSQAVNGLAGLPSAETVLNTFLAIGHSSGIDTLCGIAYVLGEKEKRL